MLEEKIDNQSFEEKQSVEDKTQETQKGFSVRKKKRTCPEKLLNVTYKDVDILSQFITITGKIRSSKITRLCKKVQKRITREIKIARIMALLPFTDR
ncbi:MAG: 30S ribosomal protein S18 [Spirochaetia bacterium]|nr:30S ribosomal protein S18 [Spirochaetota bacterium]MCX8097181.1 30S ribosomal protein S18 [Spirochaetota bacterium]MDW8112646.1 30S ribosomal protein S18 [Spirochaetia bacterium]